jgi:hypothetical protein
MKPPRPPISVDKMTRLISSFLDISSDIQSNIA